MCLDTVTAESLHRCAGGSTGLRAICLLGAQKRHGVPRPIGHPDAGAVGSPRNGGVFRFRSKQRQSQIGMPEKKLSSEYAVFGGLNSTFESTLRMSPGNTGAFTKKAEQNCVL